ncbi:MAG: carboxypeptidase-like regulatory domain-containing protein, partial [Candidatus Neomarinimicrobiota bacterium]|nr:carboxypeptidase-like regulatory domain-containing protein [Candidatus Neomarinimicrobiota bacterium]
MMVMLITPQQITYQLPLIKFLLPTISALSLLCAQGRYVSGSVYSSQTNLTLQNVNIYIVGTNNGTSSNFDGSFTLENIPDTPFELSFRIIGYQDTTFDIRSKENQINIGKIYLRTKILHFDEIYVGAHPDLSNSRSLSSLSLSGTEMQEKMKGTLAATLSDEMGIAVSSMGQATARPVLRGYSGDRFLLTDSGMELGDVSQSSTDHAVSMDMSTAQNIEIIRGAKTLLYGSNTIAGVVDIKKNSMPEVQFDHSHIHGTTGAESGNNSSFINAVYYYPFKDNQLRVSGLSRNSGNQITPKGILQNTSSRNSELFAGFSNYQDNGRSSISLELLTMDYGIPGSPEGHIEGVDIEMKKLTQKIQYHRDIKFFPNIKTFDLEQRLIRYQHSEFETNQSFASVRIRQQL